MVAVLTPIALLAPLGQDLRGGIAGGIAVDGGDVIGVDGQRRAVGVERDHEVARLERRLQRDLRLRVRGRSVGDLAAVVVDHVAHVIDLLREQQVVPYVDHGEDGEQRAGDRRHGAGDQPQAQALQLIAAAPCPRYATERVHQSSASPSSRM
ncbi:hypothetical protein [Collinsella sp. An271]|uniref:hypothetical protein n=1 Tax=Collinsella sp. An271 TaxID=1965616 RepID=UPI001EF65A80|nr:hypothetical protein [Collinsella sp. An271]